MWLEFKVVFVSVVVRGIVVNLEFGCVVGLVKLVLSINKGGG